MEAHQPRSPTTAGQPASAGGMMSLRPSSLGVARMTPPGPARVLLSAGNEPRLADIRRVLEGQGHQVTAHAPDAADPAVPDGLSLAILDGTDQVTLALDLCRRLRAR